MNPIVKGAISATLLSVVLVGCSTQQSTESALSNPPVAENIQQSPAPEQAMEAKELNTVETAQAAGTFNTLLAAAQAAGLVETLSTAELTVFAPTDAAFQKLPAGTVESLLKDPAALAEILKYHVVSGRVTAAQVVNLDSATTLEGSDVTIKTEAGNVMINDAQVTQADVITSNGVIHVIDTVLLPN